MVTQVVVKGKIPKNPVVVEAFPSKGFVSTIASGHIIGELDMKLVGWVESDTIQGVTVIHDSKPQRPIRIYAKGSLLMIYSEIIIPMEHLSEFSLAIILWLKKVKPRKVILIAGISGVETKKDHEIIGIATESKDTKILKKLGVRLIDEGMVTGISSELLMFSVEEGIPSISLMAETHVTPDPLGAASMLKILNKLLGFSVETDKLVKVGNTIEAELNEINDQLKRTREGYRQMESTSPMYG